MFSWLIFASVLLCASCHSEVIVTKSGPIQGITMKAYSGKDVFAFYGIPYAEPPVENLRFSSPKLVAPWTETLDASHKPCPCYQKIAPKVQEFLEAMKISISRPWCEDCLKLNIWTPALPKPDNLSVMVYFHGGGFQLGSSWHFMSEGHTLVAEEDIIVVSVNYRLDVFGFLKLPGTEAHGNMGLLDQQIALEWLRDNIASFGGDPHRVTIYGTSAGGASVGFHLLSPSSRGLFRRAIAMSGVPNNMWSMRETNQAAQKALAHAKELNCSDSDSAVILECLRLLGPDELLGKDDNSEVLDPSRMFGPTVDGFFITEHPSVLILKGDFNDADVMVGSVSGEGKFAVSFTGEGLIDKSDHSLSLDAFQELLSRLMPYLSERERRVIQTFYFEMNGARQPTEIRDQLSHLIGDLLFVCGSNEFSYRYSLTGNSIYRYVFDQTFPQPGVPFWGGADHGADMAFIHGVTLLPQNSSGDVLSNPGATLSRTVMRHFANFARTGDPNLGGEGHPRWPRYTASQKKHLRMALASNQGSIYREEQCVLWDRLLPKLRLLISSC